MRYETFGSQYTDTEFGFLLPNHLASSLDDATGDRAQYLSESFKAPVLAYERPSTADQARLPSFNTSSYLEDASQRAEELQEISDQLGVEHIVMCGNSAGALDNLVIAATGKIKNLSQVVSIEPVGMRKVPRMIAVPYIIDQQKRNKTALDHPMFEGLPKLDAIRVPASLKTLSRRMAKEAIAYDVIFRSGIGTDMLRSIVDKKTGVTVDLILGEDSLTTTPELRNKILAEFKDSQIRTNVIRNTGHSFADPNQHFIHVVKNALRQGRYS